MRKSVWLSGCSALFAACLLYAPLAHAQGVTGAPHGGPTTTGGNSGVNDHDAGTDITRNYDNAASSTTSALGKTTTGHHHRRSRNSENNNMNPPGTYDGPAGTTRPNNPMPATPPGMETNPPGSMH